MQDREPAVDFGAVMDRIGGDEELLKELVALYLDDEERLLTEMDRAVAAGDGSALSRSAHTLKGAVSNFCAPRAHAAAFAVEMAGRENRLDRAGQLLHSLRSELGVVRAALAARL